MPTCSSPGFGFAVDDWSIDASAAIDHNPTETSLGNQQSITTVTLGPRVLNDIANNIMERSGAPGVAIAVVHDDAVVYTKNFGIRSGGVMQ